MNVLLRRAGWTLACALTACFLLSFFRQPVAMPFAVVMAAATIFSAWRPYPALLGLAGLGPLSTIIFTWGRGTAGTVQFAETMVLVFLTGWTAHRSVTGAALKVPPTVRYPALLLALAAAASGFVHWFGLRAEMPDQTVAELLQWYVFRDYVIRTPGIGRITGAVGLASWMLLVLAAADACADSPERRRRMLLAMVGGATAAAVFNFRRIIQLSDGWASFVGYLVESRVNVHYGDKNAAGSYFALSLLLAVGLAGRHRALSFATTAVMAGALWVTGSRVALAATCVTLASFAALAATGLARTASRRNRAIAGVAFIALVAGGAALFTWYPATRNFAASHAFAARAGLARAGVQMAADAPVFGVGLGRYYDLSEHYAADTLRKLKFSNENSHNNYIQILAELGAPGFAVFMLLIGGAVWQATRGHGHLPLHVAGLVAGIGAYLLTCLGGHPLVVPEAAYPFFLALGLAAVPFGELRSVSVRWRTAVLLMAVLLVATIPWRARQAVHNANLDNVSYGFSMWQHSPDGMRYRWMGGRATFYIPSRVSAVNIPFRSGFTIRRPVEVTVLLDGRPANRLLISADDQWRTLRLLMRSMQGSHPSAFTRVDLVLAEPGLPPFEAVATKAAGLVMVGRREIEP